jgi:hypothetical protein
MTVKLTDKECSKAEAFEILHHTIDKESELARRKLISESSFETANWAYYQAYQTGILKGLEKLKSKIPDQGALK